MFQSSAETAPYYTASSAIRNIFGIVGLSVLKEGRHTCTASAGSIMLEINSKALLIVGSALITLLSENHILSVEAQG